MVFVILSYARARLGSEEIREIAETAIFANCHDFGQMSLFRIAGANLGDLSKNNIIKLLNMLINLNISTYY